MKTYKANVKATLKFEHCSTLSADGSGTNYNLKDNTGFDIDLESEGYIKLEWEHISCMNFLNDHEEFIQKIISAIGKAVDLKYTGVDFCDRDAYLDEESVEAEVLLTSEDIDEIYFNRDYKINYPDED